MLTSRHLVDDQTSRCNRIEATEEYMTVRGFILTPRCHSVLATANIVRRRAGGGRMRREQQRNLPRCHRVRENNRTVISRTTFTSAMCVVPYVSHGVFSASVPRSQSSLCGTTTFYRSVMARDHSSLPLFHCHPSLLFHSSIRGPWFVVRARLRTFACCRPMQLISSHYRSAESRPTGRRG